MRYSIGKRLVGMILIMCMSLNVCAGCGMCGEETDSDSKVYVAIVAKSTTSAYWKTTFAGAKAASAEYNLDISIEGPDNEEDYETQNQMIYAAIENGADAIIVSAVDYNANAEAVNTAAERGVKVVVIDSDVNSNLVSCRISTDNYKAGKMVGEAVLSGDEKELLVGIINFDVHSENGQQREKGFRDSVEGNERVTIVSSVNVNSTTEDAKQATVKMLKENPKINIIVTFNEWTSLGVGYAVQDMGAAMRTRVVAFDSNVISVGMLETGEDFAGQGSHIAGFVCPFLLQECIGNLFRLSSQLFLIQQNIHSENQTEGCIGQNAHNAARCTAGS